MSRIIQFGDLGTRLGRALDLVGGGGLVLEDGVIPVVIVSDATELPFANEPRSGGVYGDVTGAVGQQPTLGLVLNASGIFWLKQIMVTRTAAGWVEVNRSGRTEADGVFTEKVMVDLSSKSSPSQGSLFLPASVRQYTTSPAAIGSGIAQQFFCPANSPIQFPIAAVIRQGEVLYVKNQETATRLVVAFSGSYYPTAEE